MEEGGVAPPSVPALPEEVVRCILEHLPVSDLISCRLVNKAWNRAAVFVLNKKMKIHIKSSECFTQYFGAFANSIEGLSLKIRSLHFDQELFEEIVNGINDGAGGLVLLVLGLQKLAEIAREQIKELTIDMKVETHKFLKTTGTRNEVYAIICQILFVYYTEVEKLKLALSFIFGDDMPTDTEVKVHEEIVMKGHVLPKLNTLTIDYYEEPQGTLQRPELRAFKSLFKSLLNSARNLKTLFCETDYVHYVTSDLLQISPQLHTLHFRDYEELLQFENEGMAAMVNHRFPQLSALHVEKVTWTNANDEIIKRFFGNYVDTLCSMCLHSNGDNLTFPPPDLTFKKLENLKLSSFKGRIVWENLPALKELKFCDTDVTSNNLLPSTLPPDWPLTKFMYRIPSEMKPHLEAVYPSLAFPQFPLWFSKLSSLHLDFSRQQELTDVIPQIFHCCQQLKVLTICSSMSMKLDGCITGIPNSALAMLIGKCPAFNENAATTPISTENIIRMIEISKSIQSAAANIGNLSDLQELTLHGSLSDSAVLFGVVYCSKLRSLELKSKMLTANAERIARCGLPDMTQLSINLS